MAAEKDSPLGPKVFDVAKPGSGKTDIGSKPMIVGHKSIAEDPMVTEKAKDPVDKETADSEKPTEETKTPSAAKKTIEPVSKDMKKPKDEQEESPIIDDKIVDEKNNPKGSNSTDAAAEQEATADNSQEEDKIDPNVEKLEREEKLRKMVESKKYFVTVHDPVSTSSSKTFLITFMITTLLAVLALVVLIDAEVIDLGIELPFDLL